MFETDETSSETGTERTWDEHPVMGYAGGSTVNNRKVTHDIRTFASVNDDGSIETDGIDLTSSPDSKVVLSVGGGLGSDGLPQTAEAPESRERFASECVAIMCENDIDGIDIDWEFPGEFGPDDLYTAPDDIENFTKLVVECRRQFDEATTQDDTEYLLTAALSGNIEMLESLEHDELSEHLDYAKMMTYNYNSPAFVDRTNHNSPLYTSPDVPDGRDGSVHRTLAYMHEQGWDRAQLVMGLAFYGRVFQGVQSSENDGLFQPATGSGDPLSYDDIETIQEESDHERYWDDEAKVPFLFDGDELISYDDERSIGIKAEYAAENGHPIMYWAARHDPDEVLLDTINDMLGT